MVCQIAVGVLAALFGGGLGALFTVANETRKADSSTASLLNVVGNLPLALLMALLGGRMANFRWSRFLDESPQASAYFAVALWALIVMGVGLLNSRRAASPQGKGPV